MTDSDQSKEEVSHDISGVDETAEKGETEGKEKEVAFKKNGMLPAYKWATVYRDLKTFLRPFGNSGEGRLDFYHRSLSKAVRRK